MTSAITPSKPQPTALTKACQVLTGIITGILADGQLHDKEILLLSTWLRANAEVTEAWPGSAIARLMHEALADGSISEEERQHLLTELQAIIGNDFCESGAVDAEVSNLPFDPAAHLEPGMRVCFTGVFVYGTRSACEKLACKQGLEPMSGVSKRCTPSLSALTFRQTGPIPLMDARSCEPWNCANQGTTYASCKRKCG